MLSMLTPASCRRRTASSASDRTWKPPATIVLISGLLAHGACSEPQLNARRQHVHVAAAPGEVHVVAVPVDSHLDTAGEPECRAHAVGVAPAVLVAGVEQVGGRAVHVGAAVQPAALGEDAE